MSVQIEYFMPVWKEASRDAYFYGSEEATAYDPVLATVLITALAVIVTLLWGPKTLARFPSLRLKNKGSTPLLQNGVDRYE